MSAQSQRTALTVVTDVLRTGAGVPLLVLAMIGMVMVPLSPLMLDAMFTISIALSLVVLLAVLYVKRPLDFSVFPSVLLMVTLLRLALNVASTRVVLLHGHEGPGAAGHVIESFGEFVIGGSYAVGVVVFAILTIINFVVVTKGSGRISEVSARFILDALPGKQMAIDADLNAGVLTRESAAARREEVRAEADFYGSMDGANKFVRGDAIAGLLILAINLIGGILIGALQHGMSFGEAAKLYALLSIGDGLAAQLPALLVSVSVAMLVTRATREQEMGSTVKRQVFGQDKALAVGAGIMLLIGVVPGMPNLPFLILGGLMGYGAWRMPRGSKEEAVDEGAVQQPQAAELAELSWDEVRPVEPLVLEIGYGLIRMVDKSKGGDLLGRLKGVRRKLTQDLGFLVPAVHVRDNLEMGANEYRILIHGVPVAEGVVHADREMALDPGQVFGTVEGVPGKDPTFGMDAIWIAPAQRARAESLGYTVVDAPSVVATHFSHIVRDRAAELLGYDDVQKLLQSFAKTTPKLVEDLTPKLLPMAVIVRVLQGLLAERVPIRSLRRIVETLVEHGAHTQDPAALTAVVRVALARFITQEITGDMSGELPVYTLAPQLERVLHDSLNGQVAALEPSLAERLHTNLSQCVIEQEKRGEPAVLLVPASVRPTLARLVRTSVPGLSVLAFTEIPEDKRLRVNGSIS
jgi:flagellar biosynthesis protein FlhA